MTLKEKGLKTTCNIIMWSVNQLRKVYSLDQCCRCIIIIIINTGHPDLESWNLALPSDGNHNNCQALPIEVEVTCRVFLSLWIRSNWLLLVWDGQPSARREYMHQGFCLKPQDSSRWALASLLPSPCWVSLQAIPVKCFKTHVDQQADS